MNLCEIFRARLATAEDSTERLYQLNWCEFILPSARESFLSEKGSIFFKATVADLSGQIHVVARGQAALGLTGVGSKEEFLREAEDLSLPLIASCRLLMRPDHGLLVVEASPQDLTHHPTLASQLMSPLLVACPAMPSSIVPAKLENLITSAMYPLAVSLNQGEKAIACARALVLLISNQKSKLTKCGEAGFFVETQNVSDPYGAAGYTTRCLSTLENCVRMRLDPPTGGRLCFLATVRRLSCPECTCSETMRCPRCKSLLRSTSDMRMLCCAKHGSQSGLCRGLRRQLASAVLCRDRRQTCKPSLQEPSVLRAEFLTAS